MRRRLPAAALVLALFLAACEDDADDPAPGPEQSDQDADTESEDDPGASARDAEAAATAAAAAVERELDATLESDEGYDLDIFSGDVADLFAEHGFVSGHLVTLGGDHHISVQIDEFEDAAAAAAVNDRAAEFKPADRLVPVVVGGAETDARMVEDDGHERIYVSTAVDHLWVSVSLTADGGFDGEQDAVEALETTFAVVEDALAAAA